MKVASVSERDTLYVCHGHVTRNAKSREHTYACIVSPYVCVFVLEKLREHRLHWCHVVPGWLSPRRIASRCYVKNGNEPQTSSSSSFPSLSFLISSSFPLSSSPLFPYPPFRVPFPSFYPYSLHHPRRFFRHHSLFRSLIFLLFLYSSFSFGFPHYFTILFFSSFLTTFSRRPYYSSTLLFVVGIESTDDHFFNNV